MNPLLMMDELVNPDDSSVEQNNPIVFFPEIFQSMEESVDPDYIIGPGDEVIIMLWGEIS